MIGKAFRKLDYGLAVLAVVAIVVGTIVAGIFGGWKVAGIAGLLLFLLLDGLNCTWTILNRTSTEQLHEDIEQAQRDKFSDRTDDNPTIR